MIKPEVLGDREISIAIKRARQKKPGIIIPAKDIYDSIAEAQRNDTHKKDCQMFLEWGNETCPHDIFGEGTQWFKHACDMCWQEFKSYVVKISS